VPLLIGAVLIECLLMECLLWSVVRLDRDRRGHVLQIVRRYIHETQRARHDIRNTGAALPCRPGPTCDLLHIPARLVDYHTVASFGCDAGTKRQTPP